MLFFFLSRCPDSRCTIECEFLFFCIFYRDSRCTIECEFFFFGRGPAITGFGCEETPNF